MIEVVGVSKTFATGRGKTKTQVNPLKNVSLTIENGKKVGLVGKSGEGKSTLANILCGLVQPDVGEVKLDGTSLYNNKKRYDRVLGKSVQMIPQKPLLALDPTQRIGSAIKEAIRFDCGRKNKINVKEEMYRLFDEVGLEHSLATRLPVHISGGQAQRACIARALALHPAVLVSDESTSMLDASTQKEILALYDRLVADKGISILFISHDIALVDGFCDVVYELEDGNLSLKNEQDNCLDFN